MIRVLYVNHSTAIGGAETNLLNFQRFAKQGGYRPVGTLLPDNGPLAVETRRMGFPVGIIRYHAFGWRNPLRYAQTLSQLISWIRRTQADVIHLNHQWLVEHIVLAGRLTGRPVVCHTRNFLDEAFVADNRHWFEQAGAIIVESQAVEQRAYALGLLPEQVRLIYNGADFDRFQSRNGRFHSSQTRKIVGYCGRIVPEKGPEDLIQAAPAVLQAVPDVQFLFAGIDQTNGAFIQDLRAQARRLGVDNHVQFLGFRSDIENMLATVDILTLPSRPAMREGLPLSALEGLAAGCLIVATPNSGLPEAVRDGQTGFLVEPECPQSLAQGIIKALTLTESEQKRMRQNGSNLIESQFSVEQQVDQLGRLYQELVQ